MGKWGTAMSRTLLLGLVTFAWMVTGAPVTASAAEVKIISGPATDAVLAALRPQFERETGNTFKSKGGFTGVLKHLIESGEPFDLAIIPGPLMDQLKVGGKLVIPVGKTYQDLLVLTKRRDGGFDRESVLPVRFVPMTGQAQGRP